MTVSRNEPELTRPTSEGRRARPFGSALVDLGARGYVETEYFLAGTATRYRLCDPEYGFDGRWSVEPSGHAPYRTRLLVRRPADGSRFNGTVVVGWNNVSYGFENLGGEDEQLYSEGFAFVGVSTQRVGVHGLPFGTPLGLVNWDPQRYGSLNIPGDDYCYDIFTQAARAVSFNGNRTEDPLSGFTIRRLIASGSSQSAIRLATYYNAIQPIDRVFDGFLLEVYHGGGAMISSLSPGGPVPEIPDDLLPVVNLLPYGSHLLRDDLDAPVIIVNSETESLPCSLARQDDGRSYRMWEVAGAAHIGDADRSRSVARQQLEFGGAVPEPWEIPDNPNTLSMDPVRDAALHHLQRWITSGAPPPSSPRIEIAGSPAGVVRDEFGNAIGGIRLPRLVVPTATHVGESPPGTTPNLFGHSTPFKQELLRRLYPDRATYEASFINAVRAVVDAGFLLPRHAEELLAEVPVGDLA